MPAVPIPIDDERRVRRLRALRVLDSLPESFSESVAAAAASIADVPMSGVSFVDAERQWFKGSCGLEVEGVPRSMAFCSYAVLDSEPFIVSDLRDDPRFADHPLVVGAPHARFYAGFPIVVEGEGEGIGAVCVIDDRPRSLTVDQITRLSSLAAGTAAWLVQRWAHGATP